jgi:hypothetical protein
VFKTQEDISNAVTFTIAFTCVNDYIVNHQIKQELTHISSSNIAGKLALDNAGWKGVMPMAGKGHLHGVVILVQIKLLAVSQPLYGH